jgi:hypothetical protein
MFELDRIELSWIVRSGRVNVDPRHQVIPCEVMI